MTPMSDHESDSAGHAPAAIATEGDAPAPQAVVVAATQMLDTAPLGINLLEDGLHDVLPGEEHGVTFNLVDATSIAANGNNIGPNFDQDGVTLSLHDVLDIGTETIGHLQALVVTGDQGDVVRLQDDAAHNWRLAESVEAPDGFIAYQAVPPAHESASSDAMAAHHDAASGVYVLVQHDLQVMLTSHSA